LTLEIIGSLWTAITRARDLSKVKFYKYSDDVNDELNYKCMKSKYDRNNENYKQQDRKAKRTIPKEGYVNVKVICSVQCPQYFSPDVCIRILIFSIELAANIWIADLQS
jgi:hypothetical protein